MRTGYMRLQALIRSRVLSHKFKHLRGHVVRLQARYCLSFDQERHCLCPYYLVLAGTLRLLGSTRFSAFTSSSSWVTCSGAAASSCGATSTDACGPSWPSSLTWGRWLPWGNTEKLGYVILINIYHKGSTCLASVNLPMLKHINMCFVQMRSTSLRAQESPLGGPAKAGD